MRRSRKIHKKSDSYFSNGAISSILFSGSAIIFLFLRVLTSPSSKDILIKYIRPDFAIALVIILSFLMIALFFLAQKESKKNKINHQNIRNNKINDDSHYVLYLRTFFSDNIMFPNPFNSGWFWSQEYSLTVNPAEYFGVILEPYVNIQQIGGSPNAVGNSTVYASDKIWRDVVKSKIRDAEVILIIPGIRIDKKSKKIQGKSTIWELEYLVKTGRIGHTIAIMPSAHPFNMKWIKKSWEQAREEAYDFRLILPKYNVAGAAIVFEYINGLWGVKYIYYGGFLRNQRLAKSLFRAIESFESRYGIKIFT